MCYISVIITKILKLKNMKRKQAIVYLLALLFALQGCNERSASEDLAKKVIPFNTDWKFIWGDNPRAYIKSFDDASWSETNFPAESWVMSTGSIGEVGWYRKTFSLPANNADKITYLDFDSINWKIEVWINGYLLGENPGKSFSYDITRLLKYNEKNTIAIRGKGPDAEEESLAFGGTVKLIVTSPPKVEAEINTN